MAVELYWIVSIGIVKCQKKSIAWNETVYLAKVKDAKENIQFDDKLWKRASNSTYWKGAIMWNIDNITVKYRVVKENKSYWCINC